MIYGILGGDLRNYYLAKILLKQNEQVIIYKDTHTKISDSKLKVIDNLKEFLTLSDVIIGPIPLSKDNTTLNAPFLQETIELENLCKEITNKKFIAGKINDKFYRQLELNKNIIIDVLATDSYAIYNTIATAEGTLANMILESPINISGSNVLICGFGKCGKILADRLKSLNANITIAARKKNDLEFIRALGFKNITYQNLINQISNYDFIINTVPSLIIDSELLEKVKSSALLIEVASLPGGFNTSKVNQLNLKYINLPGIPGKVSPESTALKLLEIIKEMR